MRDQESAQRAAGSGDALAVEPQKTGPGSDLSQRAQSAELNGQSGPLSALGAWAGELKQTGLGRWFMRRVTSYDERLADVDMGADDAHVPRQAFAEAMNILAGGEPGTAAKLKNPDKPVSRAEAVTLAQRYHGYDEALPEGEVAYFLDVPESAWFFGAAHAARRNGVIKGNNNFFRPHDPLPWGHAQYIFEALESPGPVAPAEQCPDAEVLLEPADVTQRLGAEGMLSPAAIAEIRAMIAEMPAEQQGALYQQLASKVSYRSQRDNVGTSNVPADWMCGVTSIAMALNGLGITADESNAQFEDQLLPIAQKGGGYLNESGHRAAANAHGASLKRIWTDFTDATGAKRFYTEKVQPLLEQGQTAVLSIVTKDTPNGHIVRLEWVEAEGLRIDDPYGALKGTSRYTGNETTNSTGDGARGEDNVWSWEWIARFNGSQLGRYVEVLDHK